MNYTVIDVETTGLDPTKDEVIEIAWASSSGEQFESLVGTNVKIGPEVSGIHHITNSDLEGKLSLPEILEEVKIPSGVIVAHNARFDKQFLPQLTNRQWICTYRCAMHLWPEAPNHKNMTLRYFLGLNVVLPQNLAPHRALYDVLVTKAIFEKMFEEHSIEYLIEIQDKPVLLSNARFGKHKGQSWSSIPKDYLQWLLRQDDSGGIDEDIRHTARYWLRA